MNAERPITDWLPLTKKEVEKRGWEQLDVILISGDAYVDHPSFGTAVIGRIMESAGFKVGIVAQPNWQDDLRDFKKLGAPKLYTRWRGRFSTRLRHHRLFQYFKRTLSGYPCPNWWN